MKNEKALLISAFTGAFLLGGLLISVMILKDEKVRESAVKIFQSKAQDTHEEIWPKVEIQTRQN